MNRRRFAGISVTVALGVTGCLHGDDDTDATGSEGGTPAGQNPTGSGGSHGEVVERQEPDDVTAETAEAAVRAFLTATEERRGERLLHSESQYVVGLANFDLAAEVQVLGTAVTTRNDTRLVETTLGEVNTLYDSEAIGAITSGQTAAVEAVVSVGAGENAGTLTYSVLAATEGDAWRVVDIFGVADGATDLDGIAADARRSPESVVRAYFTADDDAEAREFLHSESLLSLADNETSTADIDVVSAEVTAEGLDQDAVRAALGGVVRDYDNGAIDAIAAGQNAEVEAGMSIPFDARTITLEARILTATEGGEWFVVDFVDFRETPMTAEGGGSPDDG